MTLHGILQLMETGKNNFTVFAARAGVCLRLSGKIGIGPNQPVVCKSFEIFYCAKKVLGFNFSALQMQFIG